MDKPELTPLLIVGFKASCYFKRDGSHLSKIYAVASPLAHAEDILKTPLGLASRCLAPQNHYSKAAMSSSEARESMLSALRPYLGFNQEDNALRLRESFDPMGMICYGALDHKPIDASLSVCLSFTHFALSSPGSLNHQEFDANVVLALNSAKRLRDDLGARHAALIEWTDDLDYKPFALLAHECCESLSQARDLHQSILDSADRSTLKSKSI